MTKKLSGYLLVAFISVFAFPAFARGVAPVTVKEGTPEIASALDSWKGAVEGGDAEAIVALYDKNAIMISTFVQQPITKRADLLSYYKKVVSNPDVRVEVQESHPRRFGNVAVNTGRYTLSYTQEGEEVVVPARFSFVYQLQGGKWVIVDHHSSAVPTPQNLNNTN